MLHAVEQTPSALVPNRIHFCTSIRVNATGKLSLSPVRDPVLLFDLFAGCSTWCRHAMRLQQQ
jgi:hypothetical protein